MIFQNYFDALIIKQKTTLPETNIFAPEKRWLVQTIVSFRVSAYFESFCC